MSRVVNNVNGDLNILNNGNSGSFSGIDSSNSNELDECNDNGIKKSIKRKNSISSESLHSNSSTVSNSIYKSSGYKIDSKDKLPIGSIYLWSDERRPPRWPRGYKLSDKISQFLNHNIAEKSTYREVQPDTLTICSQYTLDNHESMVSDSDRVHYYRMALFWTGHQEYFNEKTMYYATGKRVLEIGTGPMCILAMNAKNAGANRVDALEVNVKAARLAHKLMSAYGTDDVIKVYNVHSKDYWPENPEVGYDMIVSEIIGDFASQEGVCDVYLDIQRRFFKGDLEKIKSVRYIPMSASTWFVPCTFPDQDNVLYKAKSYSELTLFSPSLKLFQSIDLRIDNLPLCSEWLPIEEIYLNEDLSLQQCQHRISIFKIDRMRGPMCGFLVGIDVEIRPGEHFGTRFGHCDSWYTNIVLLDMEYELKQGDVILVYSVSNMKNYVRSSKGFYVTRPSYTFNTFLVKYNINDIVTSIKIPCTCVDDIDSEFDITNHLDGVEIIKELGRVVIDYKEQVPAIIQRDTKKSRKPKS